MRKNRELNRIISGSLPDHLFMLLLFVYLLLFGLMSTKLYLRYPSRSAVLMMPPVFLVVIWRLWQHRQERVRIAAAVLILAVYVAVYLLVAGGTKDMGVVVLAGFFIAGSIGLEDRKILRVWCVTIGSVIAVTFLGCLTGAAKNLVFFSGGHDSLRGSLGTVFPTDCATWVLFLVMILWVAYRQIPDYVILIFTLAAFSLAKFYCDAYTSVVCSVLFLAIVVFKMIVEHLSLERMINGKAGKIFGFVILLLPVLLTIIALVLAFLYGKENAFAMKMNELLHNRVGYNWNAIQTYGFKPFGTNFELHGAGGEMVEVPGQYNFIDCSYLNIIIRRGYVFYLLFTGLWMVSMWRAIKNRDLRLLLVMAVVSIHSFEEHHLAELTYNPLSMIALANWTEHTEVLPEADTNRRYGFREYVPYLCVSVFAALMAACLLHILRPMRTVLDLYTDAGGRPEMILAIPLILLLIAATGLTGYGIVKTGKNRSQDSREKGHRTGIRWIAAGAAAYLILIVGCTVMIGNKSDLLATRLETEEDALSRIMAVHTVPVYTDVLPSIYRKHYPEIRDSLYTGDDLARYENATVITEAVFESYHFFYRGYFFTQISENTAVYTTDQAVFRELEKAGYHVAAYHYTDKPLQIEDEVKSEEFVLYGGNYQVSVEAELMKGSIKPGVDIADGSTEPVGSISVLPYKQLPSAYDEMLYFDDFADDVAQKTFICYLDATPAARIACEAEDGYDIRMKTVTIRQFPDMDIHRYYDEKHQIIRSEYYDRDGNRITNEDNAGAREFGYDEAGNWNMTRYFDLEYEPMYTNGGYAEGRWEYDDRGNIIREQYYDLDGKPVINSDLGFSYAEYEYDEAGNNIRGAFYDVSGEPADTVYGYSGFLREYSSDGEIVKEETW